MSNGTDGDPLENARETFVHSWGALGSSWGISRTMAMLHALLLISDEPLSTDEVMDELGVSRGNANTNLRELVGWGLVRKVVRKGERREYFEADKDVWTMFCTVARERKRRELEPALAVLEGCRDQTKGLRSAKAKAFHGQISELAEFVATANGILDRLAASDQSKVIPAVLKWLK
ncbi:GbsR/MarR family transcriptional regulator [Enhygromyxa salina]|nr:MarR family transcriptional regulator [Enhygromyxa salina]